MSLPAVSLVCKHTTFIRQALFPTMQSCTTNQTLNNPFCMMIDNLKKTPARAAAGFRHPRLQEAGIKMIIKQSYPHLNSQKRNKGLSTSSPDQLAPLPVSLALNACYCPLWCGNGTAGQTPQEMHGCNMFTCI